MNPSRDEEASAARSLLCEHFPDVDWTEKRLSFEAFFLSKGWLTAGDMVPTVDAKKELERLDRIERLTKELFREYHQLPLMLRAHLPGNVEERDIWRRIMRLSYDLIGKTPFVTHGAIQDTLARKMPRKQGAIGTMRARVGEFFNVHHTQRDAEISKKIKLATHCYKLWFELKGTPAPRVPSPGTPFYSFVGDVIVLAGKHWSVDVTLRKYHLYKKDR